MTPVHIFWTYPLQEANVKLETSLMMMLSTIMLKDVFGGVHIITDEYGKYFVEKLEIPYDVIHTGLDDADRNLPFPAAKVLAHKRMTAKLNDYIAVDYDIFLNKAIPPEKHIIQADEGLNPYPYALYKYFIDKGLKIDYKCDVQDLRYYNTGLLKTDKAVIDEYYTRFFRTMYANQHLYKHDFLLRDWAIFLEQNYIYKIFRENNIKPYEHYPRKIETHNVGVVSLPSVTDSIVEKYRSYTENCEPWYDCPAIMDNIDKTGYIHLIHHKELDWIMQNVYKYAATHYPENLSKLLSNLKKVL